MSLINTTSPQSSSLPIPYSAPNDGSPYGMIPSLSPSYSPRVLNETKRRRDYYQEAVLCPGGEASLFDIGLDHWASFEGISDTTNLMSNLNAEEWLGFVFPVVAVGILGYWLFKGQ